MTSATTSIAQPTQAATTTIPPPPTGISTNPEKDPEVILQPPAAVYLSPSTDPEKNASLISSSPSEKDILERSAYSEPTLPLRPTLRDRWNYLLLRIFSEPWYYHRQLTRSRLGIFIAGLLFILLLLIITLPATLSGAHGIANRVSLPLGKSLYQGDGTYYIPSTGACGIVSTSSEMIVAISQFVFDSAGVANPNLNPFCGRKIRVRRAGMQKGVEVRVVDRCVGCKAEDLDLSLRAFEMLAKEVEGRVKVEWAWV
ncbi:riboflavin aldehyde-forming enzyme [Pyronema omphalodes]|nr:riboflavin aldehyde-forming enzyme [Pyronema omphalodes]